MGDYWLVPVQTNIQNGMVASSDTLGTKSVFLLSYSHKIVSKIESWICCDFINLRLDMPGARILETLMRRFTLKTSSSISIYLLIYILFHTKSLPIYRFSPLHNIPSDCKRFPATLLLTGIKKKIQLLT